MNTAQKNNFEPADIAIILPNMGGGGTERVRLLLIQEFIQRGFEVDIVLFNATGELLNEIPNNCRVIELGAKRIRQVPFKLRNYITKYKPRTLLVALWPVTAITCLVNYTCWSRPKLVVTEHNDFRHNPSLSNFEKNALRYFGKWIYSLADAVGAVSQGVAESISQKTNYPLSKIHVIYNPIRPILPAEIDHSDQVIQEWWESSSFKLIAVGSLKKQKGFDVLLSATSLLSKLINVKLIIIGEGPLRKSLERQISNLNLENNVMLPGFRKNPFPFMQQADLFVLSSFTEGLPGVLIEALACGTPVVSTDCQSGPSEILEGGTYGALIPVGDVNALASAMLQKLYAPLEKSYLQRRAASFKQDAAATNYLRLLSLI